jgi:hypothetical protein
MGSLCVRCYPKVAPSSISYNSQLLFPTKESISILESCRAELFFAHNLNLMASSLYRYKVPSMLEVLCPIPSPLESPHQAWYKSRVSLQCFSCALGVAGTSKRVVRDTHLYHVESLPSMTIFVVGTSNLRFPFSIDAALCFSQGATRTILLHILAKFQKCCG